MRTKEFGIAECEVTLVEFPATMEFYCKTKRGKKTKVFGASESELQYSIPSCFFL
jgi:hypothetical protein